MGVVWSASHTQFCLTNKKLLPPPLYCNGLNSSNNRLAAALFPFYLMSYLPYTLIKSIACPVNVSHLLWHIYLPLNINIHIWQITFFVYRIKFESSSDSSDDELNKTNLEDEV